MFCFNCGTQLPDGARFCSSCGTSLSTSGNTPAASPSPAPVSPPAYSSSPSTPQAYPQAGGSHSPAPASTILLSPQGYPQPAFQRLASTLFDALDRSFQPQNTRGLEVSKMEQYRLLGGLTNPPFYGEYVLPTYCSVIGIELVPNQPPTAPVLTWKGWAQFLSQKIQLEPEQTCFHLGNVCRALGVPVTFSRADFPPAPDPQARAKENQFRQAIQALIRKSLAARQSTPRFGGWGGFGGGGGAAGGGGGGWQTASSFLDFGTAMLNTGMFGGGGA